MYNCSLCTSIDYEYCSTRHSVFEVVADPADSKEIGYTVLRCLLSTVQSKVMFADSIRPYSALNRVKLLHYCQQYYFLAVHINVKGSLLYSISNFFTRPKTELMFREMRLPAACGGLVQVCRTIVDYNK